MLNTIDSILSSIIYKSNDLNLYFSNKCSVSYPVTGSTPISCYIALKWTSQYIKFYFHLSVYLCSSDVQKCQQSYIKKQFHWTPFNLLHEVGKSP